MIALSGQSWAVLAVVAIAVVYLGWQAWRSLRRNAEPGCCATGCASAGKNVSELAPQGDTKSFIPADHLADLARRHGQARKDPEQAR